MMGKKLNDPSQTLFVIAPKNDPEIIITTINVKEITSFGVCNNPNLENG